MLRLYQDVFNAISRLNFSTSPSESLAKLCKYKFTWVDIAEHVFLAALAAPWLVLVPIIPFLLKLMVPPLVVALLVTPVTGQLFIPAAPVLIWANSWYASQFIPSEYRPQISVALLPTLESVLYGRNISDILTRYTNPILNVLAWLPYGVIHFTAPFIVAAALWLWRPNAGKENNEALKLWARAFGYMNLVGVLIQLAFPCSPP
ncbi:Aureobasidin resistance protein Aur1, partial [Ceratobasidium sp. 428]